MLRTKHQENWPSPLAGNHTNGLPSSFANQVALRRLRGRKRSSPTKERPIQRVRGHDHGPSARSRQLAKRFSSAPMQHRGEGVYHESEEG
jgi:hypothetical protein